MPVFLSTVTYREVPGFPAYRVGDDGTVWSCYTRARGCTGPITLGNEWRRLKPERTKRDGVLRIGLCSDTAKKKKFSVGQLVLTAFAGPCPAGLQCCHADDNQENNRLSNLRWDTYQSNVDDKKRNRRVPTGERNGRAKLTTDQVVRIRNLYCEGRSVEELANLFATPKATIWNIISRKTWRSVGGKTPVGSPGEGGKLYARDAAIQVLTEAGVSQLMWGDDDLFSKIASLLGWEYRGSETKDRIREAISKHPGSFIKSYTKVKGMRQRALVLRLPSQTGEPLAQAG